MSFGSVLKSAWKAVSSPMEWMTSPLGMLAGYGMDFLGNYYAQDQANKANLKLWREQAEYNKPINQMARLQEAGLNPNLIYGSGGVQNTITSAPKMESPNLPSLNLMAYQQVLNGKAQYELLKAQAEKTRLDQSYVIQKMFGQIYDNVYKNLENEYKSYENAYYKQHGTVKGTGSLNFLIDRAVDEVLGPLGGYVGGAVGKMVGDAEVRRALYHPEVVDKEAYRRRVKEERRKYEQSFYQDNWI